VLEQVKPGRQGLELLVRLRAAEKITGGWGVQRVTGNELPGNGQLNLGPSTFGETPYILPCDQSPSGDQSDCAL
jgi:hypothetical protein